jgi:phage terminase large subunit-like protein
VQVEVEKTALNDPDWTVGVKFGRDQNGGYWLLDVVRQRANPRDVERLLLNTATQDGKRVSIGFGQDRTASSHSCPDRGRQVRNRRERDCYHLRSLRS